MLQRYGPNRRRQLLMSPCWLRAHTESPAPAATEVQEGEAGAG